MQKLSVAVDALEVSLKATSVLRFTYYFVFLIVNYLFLYLASFVVLVYMSSIYLFPSLHLLTT